jgi:hypothetical protein
VFFMVTIRCGGTESRPQIFGEVFTTTADVQRYRGWALTVLRQFPSVYNGQSLLGLSVFSGFKFARWAR